VLIGPPRAPWLVRVAAPGGRGLPRPSAPARASGHRTSPAHGRDDEDHDDRHHYAPAASGAATTRTGVDRSVTDGRVWDTVLPAFRLVICFRLSGVMTFPTSVHAPMGWNPLQNMGEPAALYSWIVLLIRAVGGGGRYAVDTLGARADLDGRGVAEPETRCQATLAGLGWRS
jgi:hypothetical protein